MEAQVQFENPTPPPATLLPDDSLQVLIHDCPGVTTGVSGIHPYPKDPLLKDPDENSAPMGAISLKMEPGTQELQ